MISKKIYQNFNALTIIHRKSYIFEIYEDIQEPFGLFETRQSEMANTSPRHMPVLGNVHPINRKYICSWHHFSVLSSFYIFNRSGYPRGCHEIYFKEIVGPVFEIYTIALLGSISTYETWRHICIRSTLTYREYVYTSLYDLLNITIVMGSQIS